MLASIMDPGTSYPIEMDTLEPYTTQMIEYIQISTIQAVDPNLPVMVWCEVHSHVYRGDLGVKQHGRDLVVQDWMDHGGKTLSHEQLGRLYDLVGWERDWGQRARGW
jgi:hypothetical protein